MHDSERPAGPALPRFRRYTSPQRRAMLIEAGLACLARGGILAFTIDNICTEAGVSRGLITHHFRSKSGLLAAVYTEMYQRTLDAITPPAGTEADPAAIIRAVFATHLFNRESMNIWLALWGEIANNPDLQVEHRRLYGEYRRLIAGALSALAARRGIAADTDQLAVMFISLFDGLWLEQCIDPGVMSAEKAEAACFRLIEDVLGPLDRGGDRP